jgi:hypothetical protein
VLRARAEEGRLLIETEDECGGIPQSESDLFQQFGDRRESHRAGLGLGTLDCEEGGSGARRRYTVLGAGRDNLRDSPSNGRSRRHLHLIIKFAIEGPLAQRRWPPGRGPLVDASC